MCIFPQAEKNITQPYYDIKSGEYDASANIFLELLTQGEVYAEAKYEVYITG